MLRRLRGISVLFLGLLVAYGAILTLNWPFTKAAVIETLQKRSLRTVTIGQFRNTYFPPGCVATDIRFLRIKHPDQTALLTIDKLVIKDGFLRLLLGQKRLDSVKVIGLHLRVPAKEPAGEPSPVMPLTHSDAANPVTIGEILADGAVLEFLAGQPEETPFRLTIEKLSLYEVGSDQPVAYKTEIENTLPTGLIRSSGRWGPWDPAHPETTPVDGDYTYENADLSKLPGVCGTMTANGHFHGTLGRIATTGQANVARFQVKGSSHTQDVKTDFDAAVDATKGDVTLNRVLATFNKTALTIRGSVIQKNADLSVSSAGRARVEDLLGLFTSSNGAEPLSGNVRLQGRIELPAGEAAFLERLAMTGRFGVDDSLFANKTTERELAKLSVSAVKGDKEEDRENPQTVLSNVTGQVTATKGVAHFENLGFSVPGADAKLEGTFSLENYQCNMRGVLTTNGDIADTETGVKSVLLKVMTPFFRKKKHERMVPFKISGPYGKATVSLDLFDKRK